VRDRPFLFIRRILTRVPILVLAVILIACGTLPQIRAEQRIFLDFSLEFWGEYQLPKTTFQETPVGGLSALTYDRKMGRFYALSDDRSKLAPARFYTLNFLLKPAENGKMSWEKIELENVTFLKNAREKPYKLGSIDPEGIAVSPRGTVFISSEGDPKWEIQPAIAEFDLETGQLKENLRLPQRYLFNESDQQEEPPRGVQENLGFEALTLSAPSLAAEDPFRLFTATESSLVQDDEEPTSEQGPRLRLLHYLIDPVGPPVLVSENLYILDPAPMGSVSNGLTDLVALEREGFLLSLERTYGLMGNGAKIFQISGGDATDTTQIPTLKGNLAAIRPMRKQLLLDLSELGITLDNLEGMALGPHLPGGGQMLVLVSDNNFSENQKTQFLLFRLLEQERSLS
jgi:hypothetical protein